MRKFRLMISIIMLAALSGSAMAEWVRISGNAIEDNYVDPVTMRHSGDIVLLWVLIDYRAEQIRNSGFRFLSSKTQYEFNCKGTRARIVSTRLHSANMANGFSVDATQFSLSWTPVAPGSADHAFWKFACGKM
jgi:hypothetical protein